MLLQQILYPIYVCISIIFFPNSISCGLLFDGNFTSFQGDPKAPLPWKKGCPHYDKLRQLFAPNTAIRTLQISSNTSASNIDEERALKKELTNDVCRTQLGHDDRYSSSLKGIPRNNSRCPDQMQCSDKCPLQDSNAKGKKVAK